MYKKNSHIHFIGIGGIGMSGLAQILAKRGYTVSGCDNNNNQKTIHDAQQSGCSIAEGNFTKTCKNKTIDLFVYTTAIRSNNPELMFAHQNNIKTVHRAKLLAELMRTHHGIAISGSHGKTTTSSLIAHLLLEANLDPSIAIGGHLNSINNNAHHGTGDFFVAEADESDRSMCELSPSLAVITNIDLEHLETYRNLHDVTQTFEKFLNKLTFYGKAILCIDSEQVRSLLPLQYNQAITYGITPTADWTAKNIIHSPDYSTFDAYYQNSHKGQIQVNLPGIHNVTNSLAVLAVGHELDISFTVRKQALKSFTGIDRRFTFKGTSKQGAAVFDDYGHHPLEIKHTVETARRKTKGKISMLFQPHRYTRTQKLWDDFVDIFTSTPIDYLIITDIYESSETPIPGITSKDLIAAIKLKKPSLQAFYFPLKPGYHELEKAISSQLQNGDLLLLQGAGKVNDIYAQLIKK
ncbi:MAG: UDP-N-acetylmuramate--alanine ligase [Alteromonas naphthalenivorans]|jgi:UDP-N-acetylmuramate--alanine ligase